MKLIIRLIWITFFKKDLSIIQVIIGIWFISSVTLYEQMTTLSFLTGFVQLCCYLFLAEATGSYIKRKGESI